jgi:hypothetical protein
LPPAVLLNRLGRVPGLAIELADVSQVVSLLVALTALVISAASYWNSAAKPAEITLDYLPDDGDVRGGR